MFFDLSAPGPSVAISSLEDLMRDVNVNNSGRGLTDHLPDDIPLCM